MLALVWQDSHYLGVEFSRGGNPKPEQDRPQPSLEELAAELKNLEAHLAMQKPELDTAMSQLTARIDKFISDQERVEEIKVILAVPQPEA